MSKKFANIENTFGGYTIERARTTNVHLPLLSVAARKPVHHSRTDLVIRDPSTGSRELLTVEKAHVLSASIGKSSGMGLRKGEVAKTFDTTRFSNAKTVGEFLQNNRATHERNVGMKWDKYNLALANCQNFTANGLEASGLRLSADERSFIVQDAKGMVPKVAQPFLNTVTDAASWFTNSVLERNINLPVSYNVAPHVTHQHKA